MSVRPSVRPSVRLSVRPVTTEPIRFYSSGYIPSSPVVVLGYFLGGLDTPNPPKNKNKKKPIFFFFFFDKDFLVPFMNFALIFLITSWGKATIG